MTNIPIKGLETDLEENGLLKRGGEGGREEVQVDKRGGRRE